MKVVAQTNLMARGFGHEEAIRKLARAGFDGLDLSLFDMKWEGNVWERDDWREYALHLKDVAAECGVSFRQSHAPFPSSKLEEGYDEFIYQKILRAMEAASLAGVRDIVVHARHEVPYLPNRDKLYRDNMAFFRSLIPYCEKWNIRVCVENLLEKGQKRGYVVNSICSQPEELCAMLDELDSPWMVGCLDVGHSLLVGVDPADYIRALGKKRLQAVHLHDTTYVNDNHTMPFLLNQDWESITRALAEIGYEGDFTFEADSIYHGFPLELYEDVAVMLCKVGRYLVKRIEAYKEQ